MNWEVILSSPKQFGFKVHNTDCNNFDGTFGGLRVCIAYISPGEFSAYRGTQEM